MADNKRDNNSQNRPPDGGRIVQIIPAAGWRVFEFTQNLCGQLSNREVPVIGWGLQENGNTSLLIPHPNESIGHAVVSIADAPASVGQRDSLKAVHYQAITPFEDPTEAETKAQFVLNFVGSNIKAADDRINGKASA
ncbi:MAG: hypothetical protein WAK20_14770 [Candidatus Acidiferrum sp.]